MAWGEEPKWPNFKLIRRCSDLKKKKKRVTPIVLRILCGLIILNTGFFSFVLSSLFMLLFKLEIYDIYVSMSFLTDRKAAIRLDMDTLDLKKKSILRLTGSTYSFYTIYCPLCSGSFSHAAKEPGIVIRGYVDDGLLTCRAKKKKVCPPQE